MLEIAEELGVTDQLLIKGGHLWPEVQQKLAEHEHNLMYMPVVTLDGSPWCQMLFESYINGEEPQMAYELCFNELNDEVEETVSRVLASGSKVWVNTIWASLCGGYDDDRAYDCGDPASVYNPILDLGVSIIQTDRPEFLIRYLESIGRR